MVYKFNKPTKYYEYMENDIYSKSEVDALDFINFEPKIGLSYGNRRINYSISGLTFNIVNTHVFLGGYYTLVNDSITLPANSTVYVYLNRGTNRYTINITYSSSAEPNGFNKICVARVVTSSTAITTVSPFDISPNLDISNMVSFAKHTMIINAGSTSTLSFAACNLIYKENKTFLDTIIKVYILDTSSNRYIETNDSMCSLWINSTGNILNITNNTSQQNTFVITIFG